MFNLRRKVIVSRDAYAHLDIRLAGAKKVVENAKGLKVEYVISDEDVGEPDTFVDSQGRRRINHYWFQGKITNKAAAEGYNGAVFIFTLEDAERWNNLGSGLKGSMWQDGDRFDEMWIRSDHDTMDRDGFRIERTLIHEEGHCVEDRGITDLEVHDFDRNTKGDLEGFFEKVDATDYAPNQRKMLLLVLLDLLLRKLKLLTLMNKGMTHPIPPEYREDISQGFLTPNSIYQSGVHNGTDWVVPEGTPIYAPMEGMVDRVYRGHPELGNACHFLFKDTDGVQRGMRIMHLQEAPLPGFYEKGETIALSGNTGKVRGESGGYHAHIDLWADGDINVAKILTKEGVVDNLLDPYQFFLDT